MNEYNLLQRANCSLGQGSFNARTLAQNPQRAISSSKPEGQAFRGRDPPPPQDRRCARARDSARRGLLTPWHLPSQSRRSLTVSGLHHPGSDYRRVLGAGGSVRRKGLRPDHHPPLREQRAAATKPSSPPPPPPIPTVARALRVEGPTALTRRPPSEARCERLPLLAVCALADAAATLQPPC